METQRLKSEALESFRILAPRAGLDPDRYRPTRQWVKSMNHALHIVLRLDADGAEPVVAKKVFLPDDAQAFTDILAAHKHAASALAGHPVATVPEILAEDADLRTYVMQFLPGRTVLDLCREADDHAPYLYQAGRWLDAYHAATFDETREFQPKFMARHMLHLAKQAETGERKLSGKKRFVQLANQIQDFVPDCSGQMSKVAAKHGDLNAHNILISSDQTGGFDFQKMSLAPVGYDIARFLLNYTENVGALDSIPKGHVVPPVAMDAFFQGYTFVPKDDPGVRFLLRIQVLSDWNRMRTKMNARTLIRFGRLKTIAKRAFS